MNPPPPDRSKLLPAPRLLIGNPGEPLDLTRCAYGGPIPCAADRLLATPDRSQQPTATVRARVEPSRFAPGAYSIAASGTTVTLAAGDDAGVRHGLATIAQIRALPADGRTGAFRAEDAPSFPTRGVMLDISRCRVPTMGSLFELVDHLERLKYNHLQLYTEHTFAYRSHRPVWADASPLTHDEARTLDAYARERGVELCPNQNTLGHLERWFAHDAYLPLAEITDRNTKWVFETDDGRPIERTGPFSLCPADPLAVEFVAGLLDELLPCFSSDRVNIGLDEAFDLGQGRSASETRAGGASAIVREYLSRIDSAARAHGKAVMFWADRFLRDPSPANTAPEGSTALVWGYEADAPFAAQGGALRERGIDHWVCPGTSCWRSFAGRSSVRRANTASASRAGAGSGATGFLLTEWGDLGHRQHWPVALHSIALASQSAWDSDRPEAPPRASGIVLGGTTGALGEWLETLGDTDEHLRAGLRNGGAMFAEFDAPLGDDLPADAVREIEPWAETARTLAGLRENLPAAPCLVRRELLNTLDLCEVGVRKAILRREANTPGAAPDTETARSIAAQLEAATAERRELWLARSRPGGLDESLGYDRRVIDDLLAKATP